MCIWRSKDVTCQAVSSRNREYFLRLLYSRQRGLCSEQNKVPALRELTFLLEDADDK